MTKPIILTWEESGFFPNETQVKELERTIIKRTTHLQAAIEISRPKNEEKRVKRNLASTFFDYVGDFLSLCCSVATHADANTLFDTQEKTLEYMNRLKEGLQTEHRNVVKIQKEIISLSSGLSFNQTPIDITRQINRLYRLHYDNLANLQLINSISEIQHYNEILSHCRSNLIPLSAINNNQLKKDLEDIDEEARKNSYQLAIPITKIDQYYSLELTTCQFNGPNIVVTLRIPLVPVGEKYDLYEFIPIPFRHQDSICSLKHAPSLVAYSETQTKTLAIPAHYRHECNPNKGVCFLNPYLTNSLISQNSITKLLSGGPVKQVRKACPLKCVREKIAEPRITKLDQHNFVIMDGPEDMIMQCPNHTEVINTSIVGAIKIFVPCRCAVIFPSGEDIKPPFPCENSFLNKPIQHEVIPVRWSKIDTNLEKTLVSPNMAVFNSYLNKDTVFNTTWKPELLENIEPVLNEQIIMENKHYHISHLATSITWGWNILVLVALIYLFHKVGRLTPVLLTPAVNAQKMEGVNNVVLSSILIVLMILFITILTTTTFYAVFKYWFAKIKLRKLLREKMQATEIEMKNTDNPNCTVDNSNGEIYL